MNLCVHARVRASYLTVQLLHGDKVQGLERVSGGGNEVEADVNPSVVIVEE